MKYFASAFMPPCVALLLLFSGCSKSDRPTIAKAGGKLTLDGVPVAGASVMFQPVAGGRPGSGFTDQNGVFQISTYGEPNDGAAVGEHRVGVVKIAGDGAYSLSNGDSSAPNPAAKDPNALSEIAFVETQPTGEEEVPVDIEYLVPKKFQNPATSGLTLSVPDAGSDQLNLELKSE